MMEYIQSIVYDPINELLEFFFNNLSLILGPNVNTLVPAFASCFVVSCILWSPVLLAYMMCCRRASAVVTDITTATRSIKEEEEKEKKEEEEEAKKVSEFLS